MAKAYEGQPPCKDCKKREVGCHANCVAYKEWKKNGIEIKTDQYFNNFKRRRRR